MRAINTHINKPEKNLTEGEKTTHTAAPKKSQKSDFKNDKKTVCETASPTLKDLIARIKIVIGYDISEKKVLALLSCSSLERINYHLDNWHIHKQNQVKKGAGYFIRIIEHDIEPLEPEKKKTGYKEKIPQRDHFEQREYTDEFIESLYDNSDVSLEKQMQNFEYIK